jgi:hypothetical protein
MRHSREYRKLTPVYDGRLVPLVIAVGMIFPPPLKHKGTGHRCAALRRLLMN